MRILQKKIGARIEGICDEWNGGQRRDECDMVWFGVVWYGMKWYDTVRYDSVWYSTVMGIGQCYRLAGVARLFHFIATQQ